MRILVYSGLTWNPCLNITFDQFDYHSLIFSDTAWERKFTLSPLQSTHANVFLTAGVCLESQK